MKKKVGPAADIETLGDIFRRLNAGIPIDHLYIKDIEFLNRYYGEEWRKKVKQLLKETT